MIQFKLLVYFIHVMFPFQKYIGDKGVKDLLKECLAKLDSGTYTASGKNYWQFVFLNEQYYTIL